jgi:hypothetical protein
MDRRKNPYTPGAGRKPDKLAGRDEDLRDFRVLVERLGDGAYERSVVYSGLRGVGKTVLLLEFDVIAREAGWVSTDVREVEPGSDFRLTFARMSTNVLRSNGGLVDQGPSSLADHVPVPAVAGTGALEHVSDLEHGGRQNRQRFAGRASGLDPLPLNAMIVDEHAVRQIT